MPSISWVKPAPLWAGTLADAQSGAFTRPFLVELKSDNFIPDFLDLMEGRVTGKTPADLAAYAPEPTGQRLKLFLPAHGRYYLVVGSLVCRQIGLPDRSVVLPEGQRVSFVLRRLNNGAEEGWVDAGPRRGWNAVGAREALADEERFPMHPVTLCATTKPGVSAGADAFGLSACGRRSVYYGYISTGSRGKYLEPDPSVAASAAAAENPSQVWQDFSEKVIAQDPTRQGDPRMDELSGRVIDPWRGLYVDPVTGGALSPAEATLSAAQLTQVSLYLLLDLGDFLQKNLPTVFAALGSDGSNLSGARQTLFNELRQITVRRNGNDVALTDLLSQLVSFLPLVYGEGAEPTGSFDVRAARQPGGAAMNAGYLAGTFRTRFVNALAAEKSERQARGEPWLTADAELVELLRAQVRSEPADDAVYFLRLVYEHAPCTPVVSDASLSFSFARFYDPDAPARNIRIEMPSIKPKDLRKFKRGVGMEMSPELRDVMRRIHKGMLDGAGLAGSSASWELGLICTFSIQIIMLVAFIVMFIFLIALNFIFWWLPFLRICFPIPKRS